MLVLTRKCGQKLIINDNIEVVILETRGDTVKIGVKAPRNVSVYREEIYEEIKKSNVQSGKSVDVSDLNKAMDLLAVKPLTVDPNVDKLKKIIDISKKNNT